MFGVQLSRPPPALAVIGFRKIADLKVYRERLGDTIGRFGIERGNNGFGFLDQRPATLAMFNEFLAQRFNGFEECRTSLLNKHFAEQNSEGTYISLERKLFAAIFRIGG
jgi:hypothetical protein